MLILLSMIMVLLRLQDILRNLTSNSKKERKKRFHYGDCLATLAQ